MHLHMGGANEGPKRPWFKSWPEGEGLAVILSFLTTRLTRYFMSKGWKQKKVRNQVSMPPWTVELHPGCLAVSMVQ